VSAALIGAAEINDIGGQIFFLWALATGYQGQGLYDQAITFPDRAKPRPQWNRQMSSDVRFFRKIPSIYSTPLWLRSGL
jgi:hypothetical protein